MNLLLIIQFVLLLYRPLPLIPTAADRRAGEQLISFLNENKGDVLLPFHGYLPFLAGKAPSAHWTATLDLLLAMEKEEDDPARIWLEGFERSLLEEKYEYIILDRKDWFPELLKSHYIRSETIFGAGHVFYPVTGYSWRPQYVYRRIVPGGNF